VNADQNQFAPDFARHWACKLGTKEASLVQLRGGVNNQVYRCGDRTFWVIKGYSSLGSGLRDRMQSEVEFLQYAAQVAPAFTPKLLNVDHDQRCIVLEYLDGNKFPEGVAPPETALNMAVEFFRQLNSDHATGRKFIRLGAAEGFLSLTEHLENIQQRLEQMRCESLPTEIKPEAEQLLASLRLQYKEICDVTADQIDNGQLINAIDPDDCCISPSDFGFHNAITTSEGVKFYDFEFSGWDDPAKAAVDFVLQPRVPLKQGLSPLLVSLGVKKRNLLSKRYEALMPILSLKWSCIIMGVLNPTRLRDMIRTNPREDIEGLVSKRIRTIDAHNKRSSEHLSWLATLNRQIQR